MRVTQMNAFPDKAPSPRPGVRAANRNTEVSIPVNNTVAKLKQFLAGLETDDYILAGIIIVLILEGCDDYILLAALGYLFIMGLDRG